MKDSKVSAIIFSPCGGTRNVIQAVLKDISAPIEQHDISLPEARSQELSFSRILDAYIAPYFRA